MPKTKAVYSYDDLGRKIKKEVPVIEDDALKLEHALKAGRKTHTPSNPQINDIIPEFLRWLQVHRQPRTYGDYQVSLKPLLTHFGPHRLDDVKEKLIDEYKENRLKTVCARTVNKELSYLSGIFRWARKRKYTDNKPEIERLPHKPKLPQVPNPEEIQNFLEAADKEYKGLFMLLYYTGLRWDNARNLCWEQINFSRGIITVTVKGGRPLIIPLLDKLKKHLQNKWEELGCPREGLLFPSPKTGKPYNHIRKALRRAKEKAGITAHITAHTLRHAFGTHLLMFGTDIRKIQLLMGHQDIATTQVYTKIAGELLRPEVEKLGGSGGNPPPPK